VERFLRVYIDINNKCNLKCRMCYFSLDLSKERSVIMSLGLFKKIAADIFPRAISVNLSCAAEPLLVPNFPEYLAIAKQYAIPQTLIVTNAFFLNEKMIEVLIDANITQIDVSIDGATKKTYETIRPGSDFGRVIGNVKLLQETKKRSGSAHPLLYLDYALMRSNFREFPSFLRLAKELGADSVRANHLIPFKELDIMKESLKYCKEEANAMFADARGLINELGIDAKIPADFPLGTGQNKTCFNKPNCRVPFESLFIVSDGRVIPCTWFSFKRMCAGDFNTQIFEEIWEGPVYKKLRKSFEMRSYTEYCRNCPIYGDEDVATYVFKERNREDVVNISSDPV